MVERAKELLLEALPSLKKNPALLAEMLERPDQFVFGEPRCSVHEFLKRNGVDLENAV